MILDGGLATEIEAQGFNITNPLWSASMLIENPQAIVDAHRAFLDAGAEIIISASYQASRQGLMERGKTEQEADALIALSIELAARARDEFLADNPASGTEIRIAASVGPYAAAVLHDGSEYTGIYDATREQIHAVQEPRVKVLDAAGADFLACETIPNIDEAYAFQDILKSTATPAWVSFCCRDASSLSDGTPVQDAASLYAGHAGVFAVGVNCTSPQHVLPLIELIRQAVPDKQLIVYPNSGETYRSCDNTWHGTASPIECAEAARRWRDAGADLIGGCCRMGPEHIRAMSAVLRGDR